VNRELGASFAVSILAHGGAVAALAVLGTAWLVGSPPAREPAALYVDLAEPVVATPDRHEAVDAPAARLRAARSRPSATPPAPPVSRDMPGSADTPAAVTVPPMVAAEIPASARSEVPRPPPAPVAPPDSTAMAVPSSPATPSPGDAVATSPASDTDPTATRAIVAGGTGAPASGLADDRLATPMPGSAARRPSRGPVPGKLAWPFEAGPAGQVAGAVPQSGDPGGADGSPRVARLPSGESQERSNSDGALPPEYESYVRSLRQRVQERLAYPRTAVRRGQQGVVELEVRVGSDGRLVAVEVVAGVDADTLRRAAVAAVRGSAPFPFPPDLAARPLVIRLPVEFRLR
jgi:protein TonB